MSTELSALFTLYHQPRPEDAAFLLMVEEWRDTLDDMTEAEFFACLKLAKRKCRFLPTPADLHGELDGVRRGGSLGLEGDVLALTVEPDGGVDWEHQERMAKHVLHKLRGNLRYVQ